MYDAIDDPYTYENSTVLVNKLDLRDQDQLDAGYDRDLMRLGTPRLAAAVPFLTP
jgi:hypothetical protein